MNINSIHDGATEDKDDTRPILVVPYMWIGDFVRGHTVVRVLNQRWPNRPVDLLATSLCAPLVDYMPGVRSKIVVDLPRSRLALARQRALAAELRDRGYGTALVLPRTWKAAIAPARAKRRWRRKSSPPAAPGSATSPALTCATAFWRWQRPVSRSRMTPA